MQRIFEFDKNSFSRYLGRTMCMCIELSHPMITTQYLTNNTANIIVDGKTYIPFPFDLVLPSQTEQQGTQIAMSNLSSMVTNEIEKTIPSNEYIVLTLYIANVETTGSELIPKGVFDVVAISATSESVSATINVKHCLNINLGKYRYNKQNFPNLFL